MRVSNILPIHAAIICQDCWSRIAHFSKGLLAGIAVFHMFATGNTEYWTNAKLYEDHLEHFNIFFDCAFYFLVVIAIVSVFDSYDLGHIDVAHLYYFWRNRGQFSILFLYMIAMLFYLNQEPPERISELDNTKIIEQLYQSTWFDIIVIIAWIFDATMLRDNLLMTHLKSILNDWQSRNEEK